MLSLYKKRIKCCVFWGNIKEITFLWNFAEGKLDCANFAFDQAVRAKDRVWYVEEKGATKQ